MKYISIDTETTGLDEKTCQLLSIAGVVEDTSLPNIAVEDLPSFHYIFRYDIIKGEPYALCMNKDLIEIIKEGTDERLIFSSLFPLYFRGFLLDNDIPFDKIKVAGKNFNSFDKKFINTVLNNSEFKFHHRTLDVGSLFVDFKKDKWIPSLDECMIRAKVEGQVQHDALEDARDVIRTIRYKSNA